MSFLHGHRWWSPMVVTDNTDTDCIDKFDGIHILNIINSTDIADSSEI